MSRIGKQIFIGTILLLILAGLLVGGYWLFRSSATCFDQVQNQNETGVDCGGACSQQCRPAVKPLQVKSSHLFFVGNQAGAPLPYSYDGLFRLVNTNVIYGSAQIEYTVELFDSAGKSLGGDSYDRTNSAYILPGQAIWLYVPLSAAAAVARAELAITKVEWQAIDGNWQPEVRLNTQHDGFQSDAQPGVFGKVRGSVYNASDFSLNKVDVVVVAYKDNQPIAASRTDIRTLLSKSSSFFQVTWSAPLPEVPDNIEVQATVNILQNDSFIKQHAPTQKFQEFY